MRRGPELAVTEPDQTEGGIAEPFAALMERLDQSPDTPSIPLAAAS